MNLALAISRRVEASGARDPDSLHGLLFLAEQGALHDVLARHACIKPTKLVELLDRARDGRAGVVPHDQSKRGDDTPADDADGLYPSKWRRALIAIMLRADGATNLELGDCLEANGSGHAVTEAVQILRAELKVDGIGFTLERIGNQFRYRITGRDAWRIQKIIANGWAL